MGPTGRLRLRLALSIWEAPGADFPSDGLAARKSGSAIGIGCTLPRLRANWITARAGPAPNDAAAPIPAAAPSNTARRRVNGALYRRSSHESLLRFGVPDWSYIAKSP